MHCVEHRTGGQEGADTTSHGHFYSHENKDVEETRDKVGRCTQFVVRISVF